MSDHQLPSLTDGHGVPTVAPAGEWDWHDEDVLLTIGEGLATDVNPEFFDVDSIPDIWAQPLLFNMAFCDESHSLHEKVLGEWRGLMAVIGLSEWQDYPLAVKHVDLLSFDGNDEEGQNEEDETAINFSEIVRSLAPQKSVDNETEWTDLYLFQYDDNPLAITSPLTLVATAKEYKAHGVDWWNGNVLRDPLGNYGAESDLVDVLGSQDKKALLRWLRGLEEDIDNKQDDPGQRYAEDSWEMLLDQIHEFRTGLSEDVDRGTASIYFVNDKFGMQGDSLFSCLDGVPDHEQPDPENSHVRLCRDPEDRGSGEKPELLIISQEIARQWEGSSQDIIVYGKYALDSVRHTSGDREVLKDEKLREAKWWDESDIFSDKLAVIQQSNAFAPDATQAANGATSLDTTPVIPLNRELLHYISPDRLAGRVSIREEDGEYRVQVRLPLAGSGSDQRDVKLERTYSGDNLVFNSQTPDFEVWPNFDAPDWSKYYSFYNGAGRFYLEAFPIRDKSKKRQETISRTGEPRRVIAEMDQFPEAALCYDVEGSQYLGFVPLIAPEEAAAAAPVTWTVGVDFGTSNTTVYVAEPGGEAKPIRFSDRLVPITAKDRSGRPTVTRNFFFPSREQEVPFLTFFHVLPTAERANPERNILVPQEGHILYVASPESREDLDAGEVRHNLKWSYTSQDRSLTRAFLRQIALQVRVEAAAQGVDEIKWRYSYPSSFSGEQTGTFEQIWENLAQEDSPMNESFESRTESISTATYFTDAEVAPTASGCVCIDVGGTSADIAIWQDGETKLQTSILLASREILLKTLAVNLKNYTELFEKSTISKINSSTQKITDLEELIVIEGENILGDLYLYTGEEAFEQLLKHIAVGVSGIFHYIGLLLRKLVETEQYEPDSGLPDVYFGGNGSKMLHWLGLGSFKPDSEVAILFEKVMQKASGLSSSQLTVQLTPDDKVKHEVAYGLVTDRNLQVKEEDTVIAGESFKFDTERSKKWNSELNPEIMSEGIEVDGDLKQVRQMIDVFNNYAEDSDTVLDPLEVEERQINKASDHVDNELQKLSGKDKDKIDVDSIFILGVKAYLDVLRGLA